MELEDYKRLLEVAPSSESPDFIDFLEQHNTVVFKSKYWLCIENAKYHTTETPHLTLFSIQYCTDMGELAPASWRALKLILARYSECMIYANSWKLKTIKRLHFHIVKNQIEWLYQQKGYPHEDIEEKR